MSEDSKLYEIFISVLLWSIKIDADFIELLLNTEHCQSVDYNYKYLYFCKLQSDIQLVCNAQLNITGNIAALFKKIRVFRLFCIGAVQVFVRDVALCHWVVGDWCLIGTSMAKLQISFLLNLNCWPLRFVSI